MRDVTQIVQRLQQILHIVRQPRPGLVHSAQIAHLLEFSRTLLGGVILVRQLQQQVEVPDQRRAQLMLGEQREYQRLAGKIMPER